VTLGKDRVLKPLQIIPSPDGRYCAFTSVDSGSVCIHVWDALNSFGTPEQEDDPTAGLHEVPPPQLPPGYNPQCVWWARDGTNGDQYHLLTAWHDGFYDVLGTLMFRYRNGPHSKLCIYDYGTGAKGKSDMAFFDAELLHTYTLPPLVTIDPSAPPAWPRYTRMSGVEWEMAVMYTTNDTMDVDFNAFDSGKECCYHCTVLSCKAGGHAPYYLCTYNPARLYPPQPLNAESETVNSPIAMALSPSGMHVAMLAVNFKHEWNKPTNSQFFYLALYSWDPALGSFVKKLGPKDYICIPIVGHATDQTGWEIVFSPCGAYIALVYAANRYGMTVHDPEEDPKPCNAAEPAVHIVHIHPTKGLRRALATDCPAIRQLAWSADALLVMPKHGAVYLR